jgi:hypothetical protein
MTQPALLAMAEVLDEHFNGSGQSRQSQHIAFVVLAVPIHNGKPVEQEVRFISNEEEQDAKRLLGDLLVAEWLPMEGGLN